MSKLILTTVVLVVAWLVWSTMRRMARAQLHKPAAKRKPLPAAKMVPCRVCGAQMDATLAERDGAGYLCHEHRHLKGH